MSMHRRRRARPPSRARVASLALAAAALLGALAACSKPAAPPRPPAAPFDFVDVAAEAGIDVVIVSGDPRRWYIPESNGCGAAWLDYDGDGDMDLFVANGAGMEYVDDGKRLEILRTGGSRLYRNDSPKGGGPGAGTGGANGGGADSFGRMRFADVTRETGAGRLEWINAVATGDPDNDGDPDLYLACFDPDVYLRNDGGVFHDATKEAGLGTPLWGAGAAFGDVNGDGALDLYVANYCLFDPEHPPLDGKRNTVDGVEIGWGPEEENKQGWNAGAPDVFYFGDGKGRFREATKDAGLALDKPLCSYAVVLSDVTADGRPDILVANDLQPTNLFVNQGGGRFTEEGIVRGFAMNFEGKPTGAMGLSVEDFDGDGDLDVHRTNFDLEANSLHVNDGAGFFVDEIAKHGLAESSFDKLGWGGGFFDADCDGDLDLLVANGHVYPQAKEIGMTGWLMPTQLYEAAAASSGEITYADVTAHAGAGLAGTYAARGIAFGDPDDDGDVDAIVVDLDAKPRLLENRSARRGRWISVRPIGETSNRDGIGAVVRVRAGGRTWTREMRTTDGLFSAHDPRLHFGLGEAAAVDEVEVVWPSGRVSRIAAPPLDAALVVRESEAPAAAEPRSASPQEKQR